MKVILTRDVKGVGRAQEAVEAKDGYALNFLIPKKLAIPATAAALKEAESRAKAVHERRTLDEKLLAETFAKLAEVRLTIRVKANEQGHLYEAIGPREIAAALAKETRLALPEEAIRLEKPFKELGTFTVPVAAGEAFGEFALVIEPEA
ncbi:MAG: 50S ribosomal protein L9 [Patescibacteria group bacterium]|nr:50S ribosomal protein L9 [Patescibacteria group bacterium]MDE1944038.1 50S ribosomal protein L9 [Patescibacteria group bacterium]MDE1945197.1 50S ribosomal protein L9 [Patescibacteria group bacterium]MDE2057713.1 50S ribosomal protein L9 [Patescibacteria group bacterium]